jgi:hypothetical protein
MLQRWVTYDALHFWHTLVMTLLFPIRFDNIAYSVRILARITALQTKTDQVLLLLLLSFLSGLVSIGFLGR